MRRLRLMDALGGRRRRRHPAQENSYGNENWVDMSSYHHQTTMADYEGGGYGYMPPITHGLPSESLSKVSLLVHAYRADDLVMHAGGRDSSS